VVVLTAACVVAIAVPASADDETALCAVSSEKIKKDDPSEAAVEQARLALHEADRVASADEELLAASKAARERLESAIASGTSGAEAQLQDALKKEAADEKKARTSRNAARCAQLEYDSLSDAVVSLRSYSGGASIGFIAAGGIRSAWLIGGVATGFSRRFEWLPTPYGEFDVSGMLAQFRGAGSVAPAEGTILGARARLLFGRPIASFFFGTGAGLFFDGSTHPVFSPQLGFRARFTPGTFVFDVAAVMQSVIVLNGSPVTFLFGLEFGVGAGAPLNDVTRLKYVVPNTGQ
jgi:hypothetical protein